MAFIYGSVCSGVEAASLAFEPLGWEPGWFSEIERFPAAVLKYRWPAVNNLGDMTKIVKMEKFHERPVDLLVGGTPCQSFSMAGLRKGMDDPRGNLALAFVGIISASRARWVVWENVPGVLSSQDGRDFASFIGALSGRDARPQEDAKDGTNGWPNFGTLGNAGPGNFGVCWRVLDAQYFGVAQRRRRLFVVAHLGGWQPAAAVLLERHCLRGDSGPRGTEGEGSRPKGSGGLPAGEPGAFMPGVSAEYMAISAGDIPALMASHSPAIAIDGGLGGNAGEVSPTLLTSCGGVGDTSPILFHGQAKGTTGYQGDRLCLEDGPAPTLSAEGGNNGGGPGGILARPRCSGMAIRRLTPVECERLQGMPDNHTMIPWRGKPASRCPDGPRYRAIGNSMAVPVMRWIGMRIQATEDILSGKQPRLAGGPPWIP